MAPDPVFRTLAELCEVRAITHAGRTVVADGSDQLTYDELAQHARAVARLLAGRGVRPGDRVVVQGRNSTSWVIAAFGVLVAGGTLVPLGRGATVAERDHFLSVVGPSALLVDDDLVPRAVDLPVHLPVVALGTLAALGRESAPEPGAGPVADEDAVALVLSSSGTTGAIKSVPMTHHQLIRLYGDVTRRMAITETDRLLGVVPLAHSFGLNGVLLVTMMAGAMVRLLPSYDRSALADLVRHERLTVLSGPPTIYHDLAASLPAEVGSSVRLAIAGGQEVSAPDLSRIADRFGIAEVVVGYGMTETCGSVALGALRRGTHEPLARMAPLPGVEIRVGDDDGQEMRAGETGRVMVRGYNLARPYAAAPDLEPGGWFDTGDIGVLDEDGLLSVAARRTDIVNVSGFNVYPREVEAVLVAHPDVVRAAVVGVPDHRRGQRLVACVVPRAGSSDPVDLEAFARENLSAYKVPEDFLVLDELPLTTTGKVSRAALRDLAWSRTPR